MSDDVFSSTYIVVVVVVVYKKLDEAEQSTMEYGTMREERICSNRQFGELCINQPLNE